MLRDIFTLLIAYQLKHFIADYPLQGAYMLGKFKGGLDWVLPLLAHVLVHASLTYLVALFFRPELALSLAVFDALIHFCMDRIKASPNLLGRFKALSANDMKSFTNPWHLPSDADDLKVIRYNTYFWWSLGLDQMVHHLTHYVIIYVLIVGV